MLIDIVSDIIRGLLKFNLKMQHMPDLSAISDAIRIAHVESYERDQEQETRRAEKQAYKLRCGGS
jgi:hypothetical protein